MCRLNLKHKTPCFVLIVGLLLFSLVSSSQDVTFDFDKKVVGTDGVSYAFYTMDCNAGSGIGCASRTGMGGGMGSGTNIDGTRFISGTVMIDGVYYIHQIVGDPTTGFAQEVFYAANLSCTWISCFNWNPLGSAVNGKENPTRSAIKQVLSSSDSNGSMSSEFLKDTLANKAKISQSLTSGNLTALFEIDGRNESITAMPGSELPIINTLVLNDPGIPTSSFGPNAVFDINVDKDNSQITAGFYRYDTATGTYFYDDPVEAYDLDKDWSKFFNADQNPDCNTARPECT